MEIKQEQALITRCKNGERNAFDLLVKENITALYYLAYKLCENEDYAKDCVQDAIVDAYSNIHKFRGDSRFKTWVAKFIIWKIKKIYKNKITISIDDTKVKELPNKDNIQEDIERNEFVDHVWRNIEALNDDQKMVIKLKYGDPPLTEIEIATMLHIPIGTVKSRSKRGLDIVKEKLIEIFGNQFSPFGH